MLIPLLTGMIPRLTGSTFTNKFEYCSTFWKANSPITFPSVVPPTRLVGVANVVLPSHVPCEPVAVPGAKYSPPPWDGSVDRRPDQPTKRNQSTEHGNRRINCNQKKTVQAKLNTLNFQLARTKQNFNDLIFKKQKIVKCLLKDVPPGAWHSTSCTRLGSVPSLPSKATCARWRSCTSRGSTETPWRSKDWSSSALLWPHANKTSRS